MVNGTSEGHAEAADREADPEGPPRRRRQVEDFLCLAAGAA